MLRVRKSVNSLITAEKADLVAAILALKANGKYDRYVNEHDAAMDQATVLPGNRTTRTTATSSVSANGWTH